MNALMGDTAAIDAILRDGAEKANAIAQPVLAEVGAQALPDYGVIVNNEHGNSLALRRVRLRRRLGGAGC